MTKGAPPTVERPPDKPKPTTVWTIVVYPPDPNTQSVKVPPVGKIVRATALLLALASAAAAATITAPQGAKPASFPYGPMLTRATAPFTCGIGSGGVYVDTTCSQVCVCNPAIPAWCRSDTGVCNTPTDCC